MLVASKEHYLPTMINTLILSKYDYFFYIHRDVYDQAIILANKYTLDELTQLVEPTYNTDIIKYYYQRTPYPLNILSVFLGIIDPGLPEDMEILTGALHVITSSTNMKSYVEVNKELRKTLQFSLYIQEEYEMAWERFFLSCIPYDERHTAYTSPVAATLEPRVNPMDNPPPTSLHYADHIPSEQDIEAILTQNKDEEKNRLRHILSIEDD